MSLHTTQTDALLRPIVPERVSKDGKGFSHVQAYDVRRRLIEIFGFGGWSGEVTDMALIFEQEVTLLKKDYKTKQPIPGTEYQAWNVAYRCTYRLTIHATSAVYTETATGDSSNHPSRADAHDMAVKTAESQAFKRCAINLGDQFGLSLYNNSGTEAVVGRSLPHEATAAVPAVEAVTGGEMADRAAQARPLDRAALPAEQDQWAKPLPSPEEWRSGWIAHVSTATSKDQLNELWRDLGQARRDGRCDTPTATDLGEVWKERAREVEQALVLRAAHNSLCAPTSSASTEAGA